MSARRRLNPMRMPLTFRDYLGRALIGTLVACNVVGFTMLGIISISENDPRKKDGPIIKKQVEEGDVSRMFELDWEENKLEWKHILAGIKLDGKPIMKPDPNAQTLEDYRRQKEERLAVQRQQSRNK